MICLNFELTKVKRINVSSSTNVKMSVEDDDFVFLSSLSYRCFNLIDTLSNDLVNSLMILFSSQLIFHSIGKKTFLLILYNNSK